MVSRFPSVKEGQTASAYARVLPAKPNHVTKIRRKDLSNACGARTDGRTMAPKTELTFVTPKVAAEIESWLRHLGDERKMSPKTVEAYQRDVMQFLGFLAAHCGGAPSLKDLSALEPADVRAYMASRRAEGISGRSLMRMLAGVRAFAHFLERSGK